MSIYKYLTKIESSFRLVRHDVLCKSFKRNIFSKNRTWPKTIRFDDLKEIEKHWNPILEENQNQYSHNEELSKTKPKKYILSMFPYPSGRLHLGHVRVYTLSDVLARYHRMCGNYVIHPIGWDAFGLPAENAAIERNIDPSVWTRSNIEYMRNQLKELSFSFDWNRELATCDPRYYKWTQHIFLQLYEKGIAFQKEAFVNWDPIDKTVLANEQVDENGKSWRSGAQVEQKLLKQWFINSPFYAKSLLDSLDELDSDDWTVVKSIQQTWLGDCAGCFIDFKLESQDPHINEQLKKLSSTQKISIYSRAPYGIYGVSHIIINSKHLLSKLFGNTMKESSRVEKFYAINPLSNQQVPIFLKSNDDFGALNVNGEPNIDAKLGIPCFDEADMKFALENNIQFTRIINNEHRLINSNELNGLNSYSAEAFSAATELLAKNNIGGMLTSDKLNDWCLSRQRFWGTPIPLVHCQKCQIVPVPYNDLPVKLPELEQKSGLSNNSEWVNTTCPKCNGPAKREVDTMDTFVDSAWYFLRYLDVNNLKEPFSPEKAKQAMPVDVYIGGIEHAMTHLFVSRLISHFMHDQGYLATREPFKRFVAMGMVKGDTYKTRSGKYVPSDQVEFNEDKSKCWHKETREELTKEFEKMSKSKLNGVDPQFMIRQYGVDFTRFFLLSFVHPKSDRNFSLSADMIDGTFNTFQRIASLIDDVCTSNQSVKCDESIEKFHRELNKERNTHLAMLTYNLEDNFNMPSYLVAISKLLKYLKNVKPEFYTKTFHETLVELLIIISPVLPHFANECWFYMKQSARIKNDLIKFDTSKLITEQDWPILSDTWLLNLSFVLNKKKLNNITAKLTPKQLASLDLDEAVRLFTVSQAAVNLDMASMKFILNKKVSLNATLYINTTKNQSNKIK